MRVAADLVDAEGIEALALGPLAARLGVRAPSLYNHIVCLDAAECIRDELGRLGVLVNNAGVTLPW